MNCSQEKIYTIQHRKEVEIDEIDEKQLSLQANYVITHIFNQRFTINLTEDLENQVILQKNLFKRTQDQFYVGASLGSSGKMFKVIQRGTKLPFALKIIPIQEFFQQLTPIRKELEITKSLQSRYVIKMHEQFIEYRNAYLLMEHFKFGSLHDFLMTQEQRLQEHQIKKIMLQLFEAVDYIHSNGIVHRDLKPQNIFIRDQNTFDLAIGGFTSADNFINKRRGSQGFMAPEMINGEICDFKVDVFSLGAICYMLFYGTEIRTTQEIDSYTQEEPLISDLALDFIRHCMECNPKQRLSTKEALDHPWFEENMLDFSILGGGSKWKLQDQITHDSWDINDEGTLESSQILQFQRKINILKQ